MAWPRVDAGKDHRIWPGSRLMSFPDRLREVHMTTILINTAHIVFIVAGLSAVATRFSSTAAPETFVDEITVSNIVFIPEPAHGTSTATVPATATEDMPHVVITGRRMTPGEKAAFDAQQLSPSAQLDVVPFP
jgi:hypothetical protein